MNTSCLTNNEQLAFLKTTYYKALASYNECYTERALARLQASEDDYIYSLNAIRSLMLDKLILDN